MIGAGSDEVQDSESDHYDSFMECEGDLGRILQNAASSGRKVYGGLCSPNFMGRGGFNAHVYYGF